MKNYNYLYYILIFNVTLKLQYLIISLMLGQPGPLIIYIL